MINYIGAKIVRENKMKAVHDKDLENLLKSLHVYESVVNGEYKCLFCNEKITLDNIDSIVPYEESIQFTCDKLMCHQKLLGWNS
ncbi:hypothetical protein [Thomasclavelia cocleata]|uniref:hypothetical protein n=1 Tax=Thomasclavelia cocleata TaxID=69824 RepID=UPI0025AA0A21|nr:hypothetical protein [Thomasclavelia cocleata]